MFAPLHIKVLKEESDSILVKSCAKFNTYYKPDIDCRRAVIYSKLKGDGCNKKKAMQFCQRAVCRTDSTKTVDGPAECRTLKVI